MTLPAEHHPIDTETTASALAQPVRRPVGIYEKALPAEWSWPQRLAAAAAAGYAFVEICVDESDERLARLAWSSQQRGELRRAVGDAGLRPFTLCLSAHRKYPFGSHSAETRGRAYDIMRRGIDLALDLGAKIILVEGYDVFYEPHDDGTVARFLEGLHQAAAWAAGAPIMLGLENVDVPVTGTMEGLLRLVEAVNSPWLQVYADMANLPAMGDDTVKGLQAAAGRLVAVHVKDARPNTVRGVGFGQGIVPFAEAFATLNAIDFHGPLTVEMWAHLDPTGDARAAIHDARQFVAQFE
jgi:predicted hexulose-6-phosphate isomerase